MSEGVEMLAPNDVVSQGLCALTVVFTVGSQGSDYVYVYTVVKHLTCLATTIGQRQGIAKVMFSINRSRKVRSYKSNSIDLHIFLLRHSGN